jgi:hypothetical protein
MRMTLNAIARKAFNHKFDLAEVEAFCQGEGITPTDFMDKFARYVAEGYVTGRFSWLSCDAAMNCLHVFMVTRSGKQTLGFPWETFLAFDAGEYHPKTPTLTPDEVTRPFIDELIAKYHVA